MGRPRKVPEEAVRKSPRRKAAAKTAEALAAGKKPRATKIKETDHKQAVSILRQLAQAKARVPLAHASPSAGSRLKQASANNTGDEPGALADLLAVEVQIINAETPLELARLAKSLTATTQDAVFKEYRATVQRQRALEHKIIEDLRAQLAAKEQVLEALVAQMDRPESSTPRRQAAPELYELPIRKPSSAGSMIHRDDLADELKTILFTFDMLELLTGVRIVNYENDKDKFYFDVKQASTQGDDAEQLAVEYRLVIRRKLEKLAEVTYIPTFLKLPRAKDAEQEARASDAQRVRAHLPDYLRENLKFPYNTLLQFYGKVGKALNKAAKG